MWLVWGVHGVTLKLCGAGGPALYDGQELCWAGRRGQGPGRSWVHRESLPGVAGAKAEPHSQPLCRLLGPLAGERVPSAQFQSVREAALQREKAIN